MHDADVLAAVRAEEDRASHRKFPSAVGARRGDGRLARPRGQLRPLLVLRLLEDEGQLCLLVPCLVGLRV